jgi:uncharacterized protein (TIGR03437 family)
MVSNTDKQINFVIPFGLAPGGLGNVVINMLDSGANTDTIFRGLVRLTAVQPDIFSSTGDENGRAVALNVTNAGARTPEPFSVTSDDGTGNLVPTVIELSVTGVRFATTIEITVTVGTTTISGDQILTVQPNREMAGFDIINFRLPASLAGAGDVPIQVSVIKNGVTTLTRPPETAPRITIN